MATEVDIMERKPWDRRPGETVPAFAAFKTWLRLGDRRSFPQVAHDVGKVVTLMHRWSKMYDWKARTEAWDTYMGRVEMEREAKVAAEFAERRKRRQLELVEASWDLATRMTIRATEMLKAPLYTETIERKQTGPDGKEESVYITLEPAKWNLGTAAIIAKAAVDLGQMAILGMGIAQDDGFDPLTASPTELRAYLEKKGVKQLPAPD